MRTPAPATIERVSLATRGGWSLEASVIEAPGRARGTALFVHGLGASSRGFLAHPRRGLVGRLNAAGWRAVLFDQRGHGETAAAEAPGSDDVAPAGRASGTWSFDGLVRGDLAAMAETLRGRFEGPLALVGHGLGGLAACAAAGSGALEPDALVLFGVNVWLPGLDASPLRRRFKASLLTRGPAAKLLGRMPFDGTLGSTPFGAALGRALTHARALAGATPWGTLWPDAARWWSADAWLDASGHDYLASLRRVRCPALAFSSHADPLLCAPECAHAFATRLGATRLEHHVAGGPGWRGPGHGGLVTDERAAPLWQRSADWLDALSRRGARS